MTDATKSSDSYALVIDEKTNNIMSLFMRTVAMVPEAGLIFKRGMYVLSITNDELENFCTLIADKEHEMDWCRDPNCHDKKEKTS